MEMDIEQNGQPLPLLIENNDIPSIQNILFQDPDVLTKVVDQSIRLFRFSGAILIHSLYVPVSLHNITWLI